MWCKVGGVVGVVAENGFVCVYKGLLYNSNNNNDLFLLSTITFLNEKLVNLSFIFNWKGQAEFIYIFFWLTTGSLHSL